MLSEFEPDPSVASWKGLGTRVVEGPMEYKVGDPVRIVRPQWGFDVVGDVGTVLDCPAHPHTINVDVPSHPDCGDERGWAYGPNDVEPVTRRSADEKPTDDPEFEIAVDGILAELRETMLRKHRDYGPLNIANAPGGAINGLRVRMHDKLARINNLTDKGSEPENESLQDSFLDAANYGIIGLMVLRGDWPGCEKN